MGSLKKIKTQTGALALQCGYAAVAVSAGAMVALTTGCIPEENGPPQPPTLSEIFTDQVPSTTFSSSPGLIALDPALIEAPELASSVCYTTDGNVPVLQQGICYGAGTNTTRYISFIRLDCPDDVTEEGAVEFDVRLLYLWDNGEGSVTTETIDTKYYVNCTPPPPSALFLEVGGAQGRSYNDSPLAQKANGFINHKSPPYEGVLDRKILTEDPNHADYANNGVGATLTFNTIIVAINGYTESSTAVTGEIVGDWDEDTQTLANISGRSRVSYCSGFSKDIFAPHPCTTVTGYPNFSPASSWTPLGFTYDDQAEVPEPVGVPNLVFDENGQANIWSLYIAFPGNNVKETFTWTNYAFTILPEE